MGSAASSVCDLAPSTSSSFSMSDTAPPSLASPAASSVPAASPPRHHMVTRAWPGIIKPNPYYAHVANTTVSPLPSSVREALCDSNWHEAMQEEFDALSSNNTWTLVPRPPQTNVVTGKWVFRHKTREDGSLERYKARWVVRGFAQHLGIDYGETFSPVIKPATICTMLTFTSSRKWPVHQLDVKNAFLNGILDE
jgi:hypothetical protein